LIALISSLAALSAVQTTFLAPIIWKAIRPEVEALIEQHARVPAHPGAMLRDQAEGRYALQDEKIRRIELLERRIEALERERKTGGNR